MWSPTGLIPWFSKTEGNTYTTLLHHPLLFGEIQRSAQEVARRISGAVAGESMHKSRHAKYPSQTLIPRITLFAICLSFSSPHFTLAILFALFSVRLFFLPAFYVLASSLAKNLLIWILIPLLIFLTDPIMMNQFLVI